MSENFGALVSRIVSARRPLLLGFDIDGTLAPYHIEPQSARVPEPTVEALGKLAGVDGIVVALITGRAFPSMNHVLSLPEAWRSAEHGAVIVEPGASYAPASMTDEERSRMDAFDRFVQEELVPAGADYEEKPRARAIHTRSVSQRDPDRGEQILADARSRAQALGLHARDGSFIVEAELDRASKGDALRSIAQRTHAQSIYFAGDDLTDLPAIHYAHERSGLGVFVHSDKRPERPENVSFALSSIDEHLALVEALAETLCQSHSRPGSH